MRNMQWQKLVPQQMHPFLGDLFHRCRGFLFLLFVSGKDFTCPYCKQSYRRFVANGYANKVLEEKKVIGGGYRINAECPNCGSMDRERLLILFLERAQLIKNMMRLLHVAPEKNLQRLLRRNFSLEMVSADLDSPLASVKMDIQAIQYPNNHFDAILCNHVLEHVPDDLKAMKELYRVLKPGGWAILQVPFSPLLEHSFEAASITKATDRERVFGQRNHVRIYGLDYPLLLQATGFMVRKESMDEATTKQYALNPKEVIFFCKK